jgi:hypothetical protein
LAFVDVFIQSAEDEPALDGMPVQAQNPLSEQRYRSIIFLQRTISICELR